MKTLYLLRHAKSSWNHPQLADHERPLNSRGERNAPMMAQRLASMEPRPELIVSSPAVRALTTARIMAEGLGMDPGDIRTVEAVYDAGLHDLLTVIHGLEEGTASVLLAGHNPGFTDLLNYLAPCGIGNMPTCAIAQLQHHGHSWKAFERDACTLTQYTFPKAP